MLEPSVQLDETASAVLSAALEVHRVLGPGFLESVYEEAMAVELELRGINPSAYRTRGTRSAKGDWTSSSRIL